MAKLKMLYLKDMIGPETLKTMNSLSKKCKKTFEKYREFGNPNGMIIGDSWILTLNVIC
jgi:hypothetical protein